MLDLTTKTPAIFNPSTVSETYEIKAGMPREIWIDKYSRQKDGGEYQSWFERISDVVNGNFSLDPRLDAFKQYHENIQVPTDLPEYDVTPLRSEYIDTLQYGRKGLLAMSGRHLQHGDLDQKNKVGELFTNCFDGNTKFMTIEYGPVKFKKVVGKTVTVKCRDGVWRPVEVKDHGEQKVFEYHFNNKFKKVKSETLKDHMSVCATENHKWFLNTGKETTTLKVGDILESAFSVVEEDDEAVIHGLIFGDGSEHKRRKDGPDTHVSQGRQYCSIRLCGNDKDKYLHLFEKNPSYTINYPSSANGDPVVYIGRHNYKDLPFSTDPEYIAGFIKGWWYADGSKTFRDGFLEISTANKNAVEWLKDYAAYAGYIITGMSTKESAEGDGSFGNNKTLYQVKLTKSSPRRVVSKTLVGKRKVYCVEEKVTGGFVLANGLLTGNCSSALFSFNKFLLLLKGSGVGRSYDSDIHFIDWDFMPNVRFVLSTSHPDYQDWIESYEEAQNKYSSEDEDTRWFDVEDSAEGWVKVVTILETASFHKNNVNNLFVFNFTPVRGLGTPIKGQQNRPASGPVPLIKALTQVATIKGAGYKPWKQALFVDHYLSACVAVGGVRRSARIATKYWKDRDIFDFINVKRGGWLYTANNSVMVDEEFWEQAADPRPSHARRVFEAAVAAAYWDQTGEPGFINIDKLTWNSEGVEKITVDTFIDVDYQKRLGGLHARTKSMISYVLEKAKAKKYFWIINPCAEIVKAAYGSYCIVGDVALSNASSLKEAMGAIKAMGRMLIRTNLMQFMYKEEIKRTNRIGTSLIGIHEFAANLFNFDFYDLINEEKSQKFWNFLAECRVEHKKYVDEFCDEIGVSHPHTYTCLKPAGTVAKVMDCTEAANLPSMPFYIRWIQFKKGHPLLQEYAERGYPVRDISKSEERVNDKGETYTVRGYPDTFIVGFPTKQPIADILGDRLVCATDITIEEHFKWLQLLEKYWLGEGENNQISYTLKYDPNKVSYSEFIAGILKYQPHVRCCAVMPQVNETAYIYTPEEAITKQTYDNYMSHINRADREAVDENSLNCSGGACGIDYSKNKSISDLTLDKIL